MENTLASMMKDVYSVSETVSVPDAVHCMVEHKSSGIPVEDDIEGTERDCLRFGWIGSFPSSAGYGAVSRNS